VICLIEEKECLHEKDIAEMKQRDQKQDDNHEELRGMFQELVAKQEETDREVKSLREHIDNGWRNEFITQVVSQILDLFKTTGTQVFQLNTQKEKNKGTMWIEILNIVGTVVATILTMLGMNAVK